MNFKKFLKVVSAIVAIVGVIAGIYVVIQKLTAHKEPEYFDDNDFFECDNEIEIVEAKAEEPEEAPKEEKKAPAKKATPAKAEIKTALYVQFAGNELTEVDIIDKLIAAYVAEGH